MLIRFGIFIFGCVFVLRILKFNTQNRVFEVTHFEKMILGNIFLTCLVVIFIFHSAFLMWLTVLSGIFVMLVTIFVTLKWREREFRQDFVDYLDRTISILRAGNGLMFALEKANAETDPKNQKKIQKILESLQFSSQPMFQNAFLTEIFEELTWIQKFPNKTLQRLLSWRRNLKTEEKFRRKSSRMVRQVMIQVVMLSLLYIALLVFTVSYFGFSANIKVIFISGTLFLLGLVLFFFLGGRKLWKV